MNEEDYQRQQQQQQMLNTLADAQNKMAGVIECVTKLSQSIAQQNEVTTTRHMSALEQQQNMLKLTIALAETIKTQQANPLSIISDPKFHIFRQKSQTIKECIQEINEKRQSKSYTQNWQCQHKKDTYTKSQTKPHGQNLLH